MVTRIVFCGRYILNWVAKIKLQIQANIKHSLVLGLLGLGLQQVAIAAEVIDEQRLINNFWLATTAEQRQESQQQLIKQIPNVDSLYQRLKAGPSYPDDAAVGQQESARIAADGTRFPYVILVPDEYDSAISYPVEFMLHGGVSRPEWEAGGNWWRRGYDSLKQPDRITVVPASWNEAFWWFDNQAESLTAILKTIKQNYNVDDNRVTLAGVSDGGTGTYFFAFKQPTEWAVFLPYIGHPGVLRNTQSGGGHKLYFENLMSRALYIVNGENDPLYPVSSVRPFIDILEQAKINHIFKPIAGGGHNTNWLPEESPMIEQFKLDNPRDPFPEEIRWVADRTDRYNRNLWIQVDELAIENQPGMLEVSRNGNTFSVSADSVTEFTLLLNPEEINFSEVVKVSVNGSLLFDGIVVQDSNTLLSWAQRDMDKSMLYTAELNLRTAP